MRLSCQEIKYCAFIVTIIGFDTRKLICCIKSIHGGVQRTYRLNAFNITLIESVIKLPGLLSGLMNSMLSL